MTATAPAPTYTPVPIGELCEFLNGGTPSKANVDFWNGDIPWITSAEINDGEVAPPRFKITQDAIDESSTRLVPAGTLLLVIRTGVGKVGIAPYDLTFNQDINAVLPDPKRLDKQYLRRFLESQGDHFEKFSRGATVKGITREHLGRLAISIPFPDDPHRSLAEQKRIAAILDKADAIRRRRQEAARLADTLSWACFHWHFGDPAHSSCKHPRRPLEDVVAAVIDCPHSTPRWERSGVIALRTSNLGMGTWNWDDTRYVTEDEYVERSQRGELEAGDVVLSREGTVGVAAIVERGQRMCMGQRLVQVKPDATALRSEVLLYQLLYSLAPDRISRLMAGSTSKHLNVKDLRQLPVIVPPKPLQDKFAAELSAVRGIQTCHQQQHDDSALMFNSLVQRAFRGEL